MIKSYRGLLPSGGEDRIQLHTNDGKTGYRIVKFQAMPWKPGASGFNVEAVLKIFAVKPTGIDGVVNFGDSTLLAACNFTQQDNPQYTGFTTVIFDGEVFNQDIFITCIDVDSGKAINYYFELEQIKLSEQEALVAIVKDLREEAV
jgi:hypothetical protein